MMEAMSEELRALELALCAVRAALAVEYPRSRAAHGLPRALASRQLARWLLAEAEEQERVTQAELRRLPVQFRPLYADGRSSRVQTTAEEARSVVAAKRAAESELERAVVRAADRQRPASVLRTGRGDPIHGPLPSARKGRP